MMKIPSFAMGKPTRCRRQGFTIVEAMITVVIVTVASIGAITLLMVIRTQNDFEQERARAHQIVCAELDRVRHELYTRVTGGETVTVWDNGTPDNPDDNTIGILSVSIRDQDGNDLAEAPTPSIAVNIEVTLTWNPRGRLGRREFRETVMTTIAPH